MTPDPLRMQRRLRQSGTLIIAGLCVVMATLFWPQPISFLVFLALGAGLVMAGSAWFLISLAS